MDYISLINCGITEHFYSATCIYLSVTFLGNKSDRKCCVYSVIRRLFDPFFKTLKSSNRRNLVSVPTYIYMRSKAFVQSIAVVETAAVVKVYSSLAGLELLLEGRYLQELLSS